MCLPCTCQQFIGKVSAMDWHCCCYALTSFGNVLGVSFGSPNASQGSGNHPKNKGFGVGLGMFWGRSGDVLRRFWGSSGDVLSIFWSCYGGDLACSEVSWG